ncbi:FMN-binding protein [Streptomyces sp. NPDC059740]|uniref:FMN-binding protein n=1 Tax=Streptomyces sp. NPDC059740 TaxID=3346926 RepID=UPI00364A11EF
MRRALLTTVSTTAGVVLLLSLKPHHAPTPAAVAPGGGSGAGADAPSKGKSRDGVFTGRTVQTRYGPVQVRATVSGGRLTKVAVLQVPSGRGRDQEIAAYAVPRLTSEALGAQSATIDAVTGASYTSQGYIASLQSALDEARG